jgi:hypothetical protein
MSTMCTGGIGKKIKYVHYDGARACRVVASENSCGSEAQELLNYS